MILKVKQKTVNRITIYTQFNYALRNLYTDDFNFHPPAEGTISNSYVSFNSKEPGIATVNWGDGNIETFLFRKTTGGDYVCGWRSLKTEYQKGTNLLSIGKDIETGETIIPYPNHHYIDDNKDALRNITITFSNEIYNFYSTVTRMVEFPLLELPALTSLVIRYADLIRQVPTQRIAKLKHLNTLKLTSLGTRLEYIPDTIFELENLTSLNWEGGLNLSNPNSSNIRKINKLTKLTTLDIKSCLLKTYLKEFNELPNLQNLYIGSGVSHSNLPTFEEVETINQNLTDFGWLVGMGESYGTRTDWGEAITGKGIQNLTTLLVSHARSLSLVLPAYIKEMRNLRYFKIHSSLSSSEVSPQRTDTFINNLYEYIMNWELTTMNTLANDGKRNQFYSLQVDTYQAIYPTLAETPSGILQASAGFVEGVSNGTPQTPMEKIYVLTKNYKQTWNLKPATTQAAAFTPTRQLAYNQIIDNSMIISPDGVEYKNELITLTDEELRQIKQNKE